MSKRVWVNRITRKVVREDPRDESNYLEITTPGNYSDDSAFESTVDEIQFKVIALSRKMAESISAHGSALVAVKDIQTKKDIALADPREYVICALRRDGTPANQTRWHLNVTFEEYDQIYSLADECSKIKWNESRWQQELSKLGFGLPKTKTVPLDAVVTIFNVQAIPKSLRWTTRMLRLEEVETYEPPEYERELPEEEP